VEVDAGVQALQQVFGDVEMLSQPLARAGIAHAVDRLLGQFAGRRAERAGHIDGAEPVGGHGGTAVRGGQFRQQFGVDGVAGHPIGPAIGGHGLTQVGARHAVDDPGGEG
jgi:hypothetical protein